MMGNDIKSLDSAIDKIQKAIDLLKNHRLKPYGDKIIIGSDLYNYLEKNNLIESRQPSEIDKKYNIKMEKEGIWKRK